jgi:hypothetical protein
MEKWCRISLAGVLLGNCALLIDYFVISIPYAIMIPVLLIAIILIFAGLIVRKKQKKDRI